MRIDGCLARRSTLPGTSSALAVCGGQRGRPSPPVASGLPGLTSAYQVKQNKTNKKPRSSGPQGLLVTLEGILRCLTRMSGRLAATGSQWAEVMSLFTTQNSHRESLSLSTLWSGKLTQGKVGCMPAEWAVATCSQSTQSYGRGFLINHFNQTGFHRVYSRGAQKHGFLAPWCGSERPHRAAVLCVFFMHVPEGACRPRPRRPHLNSICTKHTYRWMFPSDG